MSTTIRRGHAGSALLDAMISVVIFSVGILGVVKLQSAAITFSTDAKYRADAALLTDALIGEMWGASQATLAARFSGNAGSGGERYVAWNARVAQLPSGVGTVTVAGDGAVDVTVSWKAPGDASGDPHRYVSSTRIQH
jgi:type IV pilus assembly protein PilV